MNAAECPVTGAIAGLVTGPGASRWPPTLVDAAVVHIVDSVAVMLAGGQEQTTRLASRICGEQDGACWAAGQSKRRAPAAAALVNGVAGHALDYDDTQLSTSSSGVYGLLTHPSVPVLAATVAVAEDRHLSGEEVLEAYVMGVEVACRLADCVSPDHYQHGFHSTATFGTLGAAAAAARLLAMDAEAVGRTVGIAASLAGGVRENFGTMTKPLHAGRAAQSGVLAASLAAEGFTSSPAALEGPRGFLSASAEGFDTPRFLAHLGQPFYLLRPGVSIKPYPSGSLGHPALDVMLDLVGSHDLAAREIEEVVVATNSQVLNALLHASPTTGLQAKFSLQYAMATAAVRRRAALADFADAAVSDPEVQNFLKRVRVEVDPEIEALGYEHIRTRVTVRTSTGSEYDGQANWAQGHPDRPLSEAQLAAKFHDCVDGVLGPERAVLALEAWLCLPSAVDVNNVTGVLQA